jgi:NAD(P)-dependent dehydrogenase (short-subunit alcohol dehydrogenase family)
MTERPVVIVTGASRGIGAETALLAGEAGYAVVVNYASSEAAANGVVDRIEAAGGVAVAVKADVGSEADIMALFAETDRRFGRLDALVNNAGIVGRLSRVEAMSAERISDMFRINVLGSFLCAREAVKRMSVRHGGRGGVIVNLSSKVASIGGAEQYVDYAASKAAIDTFTLGLGREVAADGIRVNAVRPGIIDTEIHASAGAPDRVARSVDIIPMKRGGSAREVADVILYLMSDKASYITASTLDVAGGR